MNQRLPSTMHSSDMLACRPAASGGLQRGRSLCNRRTMHAGTLVRRFCRAAWTRRWRLALESDPQRLHGDVVQFQNDIGVIFDQGNHGFTRTLPPVPAAVEGVLRLLPESQTVEAADHVVRSFVM